MRNVSTSGFRKPNVYRLMLGALLVTHLSVADYVPAEMSLHGLEPALAEKLKAYYKRHYSNEERWGLVQSIRMQGRTHFLMNGNEADFVVYRKRPDLYKMILKDQSRRLFVAAYDGTDCWQRTMQTDACMDQPTAVAGDFIRDAAFGCHLLFPMMPGKQIELGEDQEVNGVSCYRIAVTLPERSPIYYDISYDDDLVLRCLVFNCEAQRYESVYFSDYREVEGISIAFETVTMVDGRPINRSVLDSVQTNAGIPHWVFQRASEDWIL